MFQPSMQTLRDETKKEKRKRETAKGEKLLSLSPHLKSKISPLLTPKKGLKPTLKTTTLK